MRDTIFEMVPRPFFEKITSDLQFKINLALNSCAQSLYSLNGKSC